MAGLFGVGVKSGAEDAAVQDTAYDGVHVAGEPDEGRGRKPVRASARRLPPRIS
jgi:hypothetical protein